jgi:MYXO-CTERM domain-containing protein
MALPEIGLVTVEDAETGEQLFIDSADPGFRERYARIAEDREAQLRDALATSGAGTVVVQLTVTDSTGATGSSTQTLTVAAAPVVVTPPPTTTSGSSSGGGGGAVGAGWVLGLLAAAGLLRRRAPRSPVSATR